MPYSYNGWFASRSASVIDVDTDWEPVKGHRFPGGTKNGDVETVMTYLVRQLDARVEKVAEYRPGDDWGWAYRANVNNPNTLSCHASATAVDFNATQHPNRVKYTWTREQVREIHKILDELDGVIKWLEGFDEMHFEIRGDRAAVAAVARKIRAGAATPPATSTGDIVGRIYWFKNGDGPVAAYRCVCPKLEKSSPIQYTIWAAYWISDLADLATFRKRGWLEANTGATAVATRPSFEIHNGPYDNTKTF